MIGKAMQILPATLERIAQSQFTPERIVGIFKTLEILAQREDVPIACEIILSYQEETDQISEGDLVPIITFSLQPAE